MTAAADPTFLDTNILVYASVDSSPFHAVALAAIADLEAQNVQLWISRQVMREYLATLARPRVGIPITDLTRAIRVLEMRYEVAEEGPLVTAQLLALLDQNLSRQIHDTNIVATMLTYGIQRILTNNPDDFAPYQSMITIVPLTPSSSS
jgi:predicted nucleic acid-binding protein